MCNRSNSSYISTNPLRELLLLLFPIEITRDEHNSKWRAEEHELGQLMCCCHISLFVLLSSSVALNFAGVLKAQNEHLSINYVRYFAYSWVNPKKMCSLWYDRDSSQLVCPLEFGKWMLLLKIFRVIYANWFTK